LGSIGRRHARLLKERADLSVELCEPSAAMLQLAYDEVGQLPTYRSFDEALATRPYMLVIATPHQFHAEQTVRALGQNIHVLCEKPMSDNLADARRMQAAAEQSKAVLNIGFMMHFHPGMQRMRELIQSGTLGQILQVQYKVGSYLTLVNSRSRYQATMEGALLMDYAHQPDLLYWLLGLKPAGVYAVARQAGNLEFSSNPNLLVAIFDYASPLLVSLDLNYAQMPQRQELEIIGDEAWASYDVQTGSFRIGRRKENVEVEEKVPVVHDQLYRDEHQSFIEATEGQHPPSSPASGAIVSMEIIDAALRSWKSGSRTTLA
jgi:predicted dehydrogenase